MTLSLVGLTLAEALAVCGVGFAELDMIDEPPGVLRAVQVPCGDSEMILEFDDDEDLFSLERDWPAALLLSRRIVRSYPAG